MSRCTMILPLQFAGLLGGRAPWTASVAWVVWLPMRVFEIAFAFWLLVKGVGGASVPAAARVVPATAE